MDNNMPLSVRRVELINSICNNINNAGLPSFAVVDILEHILQEATRMARDEYANESRAYEEYKKSKEAEGRKDAPQAG